MNGRTRTEENHQQIMSLTGEELVLGSKDNQILIELTAEPLD